MPPHFTLCELQKTKASPYVSYVMLYDMLFGRGIKGGGFIKRSLTSHKVRVLAVFCGCGRS